MNYATGALIAFFVLGAILLAGCQTAATTTPTTEAKPTVAQTSSTERSVEYALAEESQAAPANQSADPFTGTKEGSWFDVSGTKGWRVPAKVEFRSVTPDAVSILYTELPGFGGKGAESVKPIAVMARDLPRQGNSFSRRVSKGHTVVFTAQEDGSIKMERRDTNGDIIRTGKLWNVPKRTPDIPMQLAPLKGIWSGRAWSFGHTMEIDVFSEGPHFVVAVDYQYSPIGGWGLTGGGGTFIEHLGPEDPPTMRLFKTMDVVLQNESRLLIEYQVRTARHSITLKKEEPVSE